jgi:hypothetical protein
VSTLNAPTGAVLANAAIVTAGSQGSISVYASENTDLVVDINGYFAAPGSSGGLLYHNLAPCRALDTRYNGGPPFTGTRIVNLTSCQAPAQTRAYVVNATVVPPADLGYLSLWPNGVAQPLVSTLNVSDGAITSNLAIVPTANGLLNAFASNPTHLILDLLGYFAP